MKLKIFFLIAALLVVTYGYWRGDVAYDYKVRESQIDTVDISFGGQANKEKGNLIGIQPTLEAADYSSQEVFFQVIDNYLAFAADQDFLNSKSIVVFPEYIGTWLVAMNEKSAVYQSKTIQGAMTWMVLRHPIDFLKYYSQATTFAPEKEAIFQVKSKEMAKIYFNTFSRLASKYNVTIVAGSILLPDPVVDKNGELIVSPGNKLYNVTAVFNADGSINPTLAKKIYLTAEEKEFISSADVNSLPVFNTPAGRLGVLVCADSWFPESYSILRQKDIQLLAIPSFVSGDGLWRKPWQGYSGWPNPSDVDKNDIGKITEREALEKYSMNRLALIPINFGINVFLRGQMWDLGSDGETLIWGDGNLIVDPLRINTQQTSNALVTNVWIQ